MTQQPALSVIVPCRNAVATLPTLLESLGDQDHQVPAEVLVCDNGSTDGLHEFVRSWSGADFELRYVDASEHRGAAYARNRGIAEARAEYLAFCDADDVVGPAWMRSAVEALAHEPVINGSALSVPGEIFADACRLADHRAQKLCLESTPPPLD